MQPKVSVTIPVYNTSPYLRQCLDSLHNQKLRDIEFIVVNDGSTDNSYEICEEYSHVDSRFKIINQKNGGLASARETGLQHANGEYIIVCDSDDWVEPDAYEILYSAAIETGADIVTCGFFTEYDNKKQVKKYIQFKEKDGFVDNYDLIARGAGWSWIKLIKRTLFERGNIHYDLGINLSEDSLITYKLMTLKPKIVQIDKPLYHYRRILGGNSYTNSVSMPQIYQLQYTYNWLKNNYKEDKWDNLRLQRAIDLAFTCLRVSDLDNNFFKEFLKKEIPYRSFINVPISLKRFVVFCAKAISTRATKRIVKFLYPFFYK